MLGRQGERIIMTCDSCHKPIAAGEGYLQVDCVPARRAAQRSAKNQASGGWVDVAAVISAGPGPKWSSWHRKCDPVVIDDPSGEKHHDLYWIQSDMLQTVGDVFHWAAHLHEKGWRAHTNWDEVLRSLIDSKESV